MELLEFLILIILISIAFGVSLQSAFWGVVAFAVGAFVLFIVAGALGLGVCALTTKLKTAKTRQKIGDTIEGLILFLLILLPFALGLLLVPLSNGNTALALLLVALPFCAELFWFYRYAQKLLNKKR